MALNLKLTVGALAENVTVTGAAPLIDTATVAVGASMAEKTVQEIPLNGRHFVDLGPLMPGGSTSPQNAGLSAPLRGQGAFSFMSAGNRETSVNFMVNGINLNDLSNSQVTFQPSINTVSEFKVDNSTFSAEYGRNSGAIVNVATRSGSNQLHGEGVRLLPRRQVRLAQLLQPAEPAAAVARSTASSSASTSADRSRRTGSFFFGSYEGLRHTQGVDLNSGTLTNAQRAAVTDPVAKNLLQYIPVANDLDRPRVIGSAIAPVNNRSIHRRRRATTCGRTTICTSTMRSSATFAIEPNAQGNTVPGFGDTRGGHRQMHDGQRNARLQPGAGQRSAGGYNRINITFDPQHAGRHRRRSGSTSARRRIRSRCPQITITGPGPELRRAGGFPSGREVTTIALGDTATYLRGNHIIKFGGEFRRVKHYSFNGDPGTFTYPSVAAFQQGFGSAFTHHARRPQAFNAYVNALGAFVQDSISLGSNVKLDLGLRYDYLPSPTERRQQARRVRSDDASSLAAIIGSDGFTQVTKNGSDFQPRVGVDLDAERRRQARRSRRLRGDGQPEQHRLLRRRDRQPAARDAAVGAGGGHRREQHQARQRRRPARARAALAPSFTDPNFLPGRMQTWNVNVEREIGGTGVMVGYFGSHGDRQRIPINLNQFIDARRHRASVPERCRRRARFSRARRSATSPKQTSLGWSDYKGLWLTANHRMTHGLQLSGSYTLSKSTDTNSYDGTLTAQDSTNLADSVRAVGLRRAPSRVGQRVVRSAVPRQPPEGRLADGRRRAGADRQPAQHHHRHHHDHRREQHVRPDLIGALPAITPTPNVDPRPAPSTSYQWFDGQHGLRSAHRAGASARAPRHRCSRCRTTPPASRTSATSDATPIYGPGFGNTDLRSSRT